MLTSSLNANTLESHVSDINDTSDAIAKVNRKTLIVMIKNDLFTFDENSTASVKKVDEDMGGVISNVNPKNDDNISLYDILAEQNKNVFLFANVPNDIAVQTLIKVDTTDSASDTIDNITNKGNNFFHYRVNHKQGEAKKYGFENMNKIRQRGKFVKVTTCENDGRHKQGDINGTCEKPSTKTLVQLIDENCTSGHRSTQGRVNSCDIDVDIPTNFDDVDYTTGTDFDNNDIVTPTGTIESEDQKIEYILVNGVRIDVDAMSYEFDGTQYGGDKLDIEAHLEGGAVDNYSA